MNPAAAFLHQWDKDKGMENRLTDGALLKIQTMGFCALK
jgi:hypothetical protein